MSDPVNHPRHYTSHPSGVECIEIAEHFPFNVGNAIKYLWRAGVKSEARIEDLQKAVWYISREVNRLAGPSDDFVVQLRLPLNELTPCTDAAADAIRAQFSQCGEQVIRQFQRKL